MSGFLFTREIQEDLLVVQHYLEQNKPVEASLQVERIMEYEMGERDRKALHAINDEICLGFPQKADQLITQFNEGKPDIV